MWAGCRKVESGDYIKATPTSSSPTSDLLACLDPTSVSVSRVVLSSQGEGSDIQWLWGPDTLGKACIFPGAGVLPPHPAGLPTCRATCALQKSTVRKRASLG